MRRTVLVVGCCFSIGCVRVGPSPEYLPENTVVVDVANASEGEFGEDARKQSKALHHFLVGQISLNDQDFKTALDNLAKADELSPEPTPTLHTKLADLYLRFGQLDKALEAASLALQEDPTNPSVRLLYGGVLESLGRDAEAEPQYKKLINDFPGKFDAYILLSNLYVKQKKFKEALEVLKTLEQVNSSDALAHFYLGRVYEMMENFPQAEAEYARVLESDPTLSRGAVELLRVLLREKKTEKAKALCERMLSKDPSNAVARKVLGHLMLGESKLDEALKHLVVLEGLEADASDTRFKIALIQMEKRNFDEAVRQLNLVLATNPDHAEARYYLASIYAGSGKRKEAIKELSLIEKQDPMFVRSRTFAAFILRQDEDLRGARRVLAEAREVEPDNKNLLLYDVLIMRDMKEYEEAEELMREALKKEPRDERLLFNLGIILHEREASEEALRVMEQVIEINPSNADALNYLAYGLIEQGSDLPRAESLASRALQVKPQDPYYLDTLGWVQFKLGKSREAEQNLGKAVSIVGDDLVILDHYVEVLIANKNLERAVSLMKGVSDRELSKEEAMDPDIVAALERIRKRLRAVLQDHPEFSAVEKSTFNKRVIDSGGERASFDVELLRGLRP